MTSLSAFLAHTPLMLSVICITLLTLGYYWLLWKRHSAAFETTGIVRDTPPRKLSPAAMRYIWQAGFDSDCLIVALLNAVMKGCYQIHWRDASFGIYLTHPQLFHVLSKDEQAALTFSSGQKLERLGIAKIKTAVTDRAEERMRQYLNKAFQEHLVNKWWVFGIGMGLSSVLMLLLTKSFVSLDYMAGVILYLFFLIPFILGFKTLLRIFPDDRQYQLLLLGFLGVVLMYPFYLLEISQQIAVFPAVLPILAIHAYFFHSMPAHTQAGHQLKQEIEAFRAFLLQRIENKRKLDEGEAYLSPYLIALEIEFENTAYFAPLLIRGR